MPASGSKMDFCAWYGELSSRGGIEPSTVGINNDLVAKGKPYRLDHRVTAILLIKASAPSGSLAGLLDRGISAGLKSQYFSIGLKSRILPGEGDEMEASAKTYASEER